MTTARRHSAPHSKSDLLFADRLKERDLTPFWFSGGYSLDNEASALNLGQPEEHAFAVIQGVYESDVDISLSVRIVASSSANGDGWAGLLMRGYGLGTQTGYLVYVRSSGQIELMTLDHKRIDLMKISELQPSDWIRLRARLEGQNIEVSVDGHAPVTLSSAHFIGPGIVALQSFHASSQFKDIEIQRIPSRPI